MATEASIEAEVSDQEASTAAVRVFIVDASQQIAFLKDVASVATISSTSLLNCTAHSVVTDKTLGHH